MDKIFGSFHVSRQAQLVLLFPKNPGRHWINVKALHVAADAIRLKQGRTTTHEGICDDSAGKVICLEKALGERLTAKFRENQAAEEGAGTTCEPLVHSNDGSVVLLYLLFFECH